MTDEEAFREIDALLERAFEIAKEHGLDESYLEHAIYDVWSKKEPTEDKPSPPSP